MGVCISAMCNLVGGYQHFKGMYGFHPHDRSEDGGSRLLQNVNHLEN